jgi:hypothetical protein
MQSFGNADQHEHPDQQVDTDEEDENVCFVLGEHSDSGGWRS